LPTQTFSGGFIGGGAEFAVAAVPGMFRRNEYRLPSSQATDLQFSVAGMAIVFFDHQSATVQTITTSLILRARAKSRALVVCAIALPPRQAARR